MAGASVGIPKLEHIRSDWVNALDHGCRGDGEFGSPTNNFAPLQSLLNAVKPGTTVYMPAVDRRVSDTQCCYDFGTNVGLTIPTRVTLRGVWDSPPTMMDPRVTAAIVADANVLRTGSIFLVRGGSGVFVSSDVNASAFIKLAGNCSCLHGIGFKYPAQVLTSPPTAFPPTVQMGAGYAQCVRFCDFHNSYAGVYCIGSYRPYIIGNRGQILLHGLWINDCRDKAYIRDNHWILEYSDVGSALDTYIAANAVGFDIGRVDMASLTDNFCYHYNKAFRTRDSPVSLSGGIISPWVALRNCDADACTYGIELNSIQNSFKTQISGCYITTSFTAALQNNAGSGNYVGAGNFPTTMNT